MFDPSRIEPLLERAVEIEASIGFPPDASYYMTLYVSRLRQAKSRGEALTHLGDWLADLGDSQPPPGAPGVFALYGDTEAALELKSRIPSIRTPNGQIGAGLSDALLASALGRFDEADQHLATTASLVRNFAVRGGEVDCLIGFAKVALDRGDFVRASELLAAVDASAGPKGRPIHTPLAALVHDHSTRILRKVVDPGSGLSTRAKSGAVSLKHALDAELIRSATVAISDPTS